MRCLLVYYVLFDVYSPVLLIHHCFTIGFVCCAVKCVLHSRQTVHTVRSRLNRRRCTASKAPRNILIILVIINITILVIIPTILISSIMFLMIRVFHPLVIHHCFTISCVCIALRSVLHSWQTVHTVRSWLNRLHCTAGKATTKFAG